MLRELPFYLFIAIVVSTETIHLDEDSHAIYRIRDLFNGSSTSKLTHLRVVVSLESTNGLLLSYLNFDETQAPKSWLKIGVDKRRIKFMLGKEGGKTLTVPFPGKTNVKTNLQVISLTRDERKITLQLNTFRPLTFQLLPENVAAFDMKSDSMLLLGYSPKLSEEAATFTKSAQNCINRVKINGEKVELFRKTAANSLGVNKCQLTSSRQCAENYCENTEICTKVIGCDQELEVENVKSSEEISLPIDFSESKTLKTDPVLWMRSGSGATWIELQFGQLVYIHGLALSLYREDEEAEEVKSIKYTLEFSSDIDHSKYYSYSENGKMKIFNTVAFRSSAHVYLAWPVLVTGVRLNVISCCNECGLKLGARGCDLKYFQTYESTFSELPPGWTTVATEILGTIVRALNGYGVTNLRTKAEDRNTNYTSLKEFSSYKSSYIDVYRGLSYDDLKLEIWHSVNNTLLLNEVWWYKNGSQCKSLSEGKLPWLETAYRQGIFDSTLLGKSKTTKINECCFERFEDEGEGIQSMEGERVIRVRMYRSPTSLMNFRRFSGYRVPTESILLSLEKDPVMSVEDCAKLCFSDINCKQFSITIDDSSKAVVLFNTTSGTLQDGVKCRFGSSNVLQPDARQTTYALPEYSRNWNKGFAYFNGRERNYQCAPNNVSDTEQDQRATLRPHGYYNTFRSDNVSLSCGQSNSPYIDIQHIELKVNQSYEEEKYRDNSKEILAIHEVHSLCSGNKNCSVSLTTQGSISVCYWCVGPMKTDSKLNVTTITNLSNFSLNNSYVVETNLEPTAPMTLFIPEPPNTSKFQRLSKYSGAISSGMDSENSTQKNYKTKSLTGSITTPGQSVAYSTEAMKRYHSTLESFHNIITSVKSTRNTESLEETSRESATIYTILHKISTGSYMTTNTALTQTVSEIQPRILSSQQCPPVTHRNIVWPASGIGLIKLPCPKGTSGNAYWRCDQNGWSNKKPDLASCTSSATTHLLNEVNKIETSENISFVVLELAKQQSQVLEEREMPLFGGDLVASIDVVSRLTHITAQGRHSVYEQDATIEILTNIVTSTVDNLMDNSQRDAWMDIREAERQIQAQTLTTTLEEVAFLSATQSNHTKSFIKYQRNTAIQISSFVFDDEQKESELPDRIDFPKHQVNQNETWPLQAGSISLPLSIDDNGRTDVVFVVYENLEKLLGNEFVGDENAATEGSIPSDDKMPQIVSKVISASVRPLNEKLIQKEKIRMVLYHGNTSYNNIKSARCVFWKNSDNLGRLGNQAHWSSEGCRTLTTNETHTECECNHLTNFAILMDTIGISLSDEDETALSIITYLGCSMSIVCLLMSAVSFTVLRGLRSTRTSIHRNLCLTLSAAELVFLLGINQTQNELICSLIAGILHYLFLSVFAWMCIEGLHLYTSLVIVFEVDRPIRMVIYYVAGYILPLAIVAITAAVNYEAYGTDQHCWLSTDSGFIWAFVGPVLCVVCANIYFLIVAMRIVNTHRVVLPQTPKTIEYWKLIKGTAALLSLLGVTWVLGIFYVNNKSVIFAYAFTISNAFQGVFFFVFHCLLNEKVTQEWRKLILRSTTCSNLQRKKNLASITSRRNTRSTMYTSTCVNLGMTMQNTGAVTLTSMTALPEHNVVKGESLQRAPATPVQNTKWTYTPDWCGKHKIPVSEQLQQLKLRKEDINTTFKNCNAVEIDSVTVNRKGENAKEINHENRQLTTNKQDPEQTSPSPLRTHRALSASLSHTSISSAVLGYEARYGEFINSARKLKLTRSDATSEIPKKRAKFSSESKETTDDEKLEECDEHLNVGRRLASLVLNMDFSFLVRASETTTKF